MIEENEEKTPSADETPAEDEATGQRPEATGDKAEGSNGQLSPTPEAAS